MTLRTVQACLEGVEPAKGIEPPTYGLRNKILPLILNKINNLHP